MYLSPSKLDGFMTLPNIDPIVHIGPLALQVGPLAVRWYGLAYVLAIVLGAYYAVKLLQKKSLWTAHPAPLDEAQFYDLVLWIVGGIIIGGRLGYMLVYNLDQTLSDPISIFMPWLGGMSSHGGFIGVIIAGLWFSRRNHFSKQQILSIGDLLSCVAPIGLFLGRVANFTNGELWGRETNVPWAIIFCNERLMDVYGQCAAGMIPRHPSQLYEAALEGIGLLIIGYILSQRLGMFKRPGFIWGVFMVGYAVARIIVENFRSPDEGMPQLITMGMILSVPMIIAGGFLIWQSLKNPPQGNAPLNKAG